jgi:hypothetical protein
MEHTGLKFWKRSRRKLDGKVFEMSLGCYTSPEFRTLYYLQFSTVRGAPCTPSPHASGPKLANLGRQQQKRNETSYLLQVVAGSPPTLTKMLIPDLGQERRETSRHRPMLYTSTNSAGSYQELLHGPQGSQHDSCKVGPANQTGCIILRVSNLAD